MRKNLPLVNLQPSSKVDDYLQMVGLYLNGSKRYQLVFNFNFSLLLLLLLDFSL